MKSVLRNVVIQGGGLFATSILVPGLKISGGIETYLFGGLILSVISFFVKPILSLLTLPFNLATLGMFSFLTNALLLYLLTIIVTQITVVPFVFQGFSFAGFIIPEIAFNLFFSYVVCAFVLSFITSAIWWIIK
ncbi:MAG: phage holin family protein [Candidatus Levyibacteriota bacterium]|nr:MAG: phage holin family protein [Candidatus Levybacteria bacterium]